MEGPRSAIISPGTITEGIAAAAAIYVGLWLLWLVRDIVLLLVLGIIVGVALARPAAALSRWHIGRALATILIVAAALVLFAAIGWAVAPQISNQIGEIEAGLPAALDRIEQALRTRSIVGIPLSPQNAAASMRAFFQTHSLWSFVFPVVKSSVAAVAAAVMIVFIAIYVSAEGSLYHEGLLRLVPPKRRKKADALFAEMALVVRRWLAARLLAMLILGIITGVAMWSIGIPAATVIGVLTGVLEFIPFFGPIASAIPAVAMGLLISPAKAVWVIVLFVLIQHIESDVVGPLLMRNRISVPPLLTIAAIAILGIVFGLPGMLVAEPLTAIAIVATRALYVEPMEARAG